MYRKGLMAASTKPLILTILSKGKNYGYDIIQQVKDYSGGELQWSDGMLYPVLHKLEKEKLIQSQWEMSEDGRNRKYYSLTEAGQAELKAEQEDWISIHNVLMKMWGFPELKTSI